MFGRDDRFAVWILLLCCGAYLLQSVGTNAVRSLQLVLLKELNLSSTSLAVLLAVYSLPPVFMVLVSGFMIDRVGLGVSTLVFAAFVFCGSAVQAIAMVFANVNAIFAFLLIGRAFGGIGGEALFVCWDAFLTRAWQQRVALPMAIYCACGRLGDVLSTVALPWLAQRLHTTLTMTFAFVMVGVAFVGSVVMVLLGKREWSSQDEAVKRETATTAATSTPSLRERLAMLRPTYWLAALVAMLMYTMIGVYLNFFPLFLYHMGHDKEVANYLMAIAYGTALVVTPVWGIVILKFPGLRYGSVVVGGVFLLLASLMFVSFISSFVAGYFALVFLGLGYALTSSSLWGTIGLYASEENMGLVYGMPYAAYNGGSVLFIYVSGVIMDKYGDWTLALIYSVSCVVCIIATGVWFFLERRSNSGISKASSTSSNDDEFEDRKMVQDFSRANDDFDDDFL